jgi:cytochrome c-type protein NapB
MKQFRFTAFILPVCMLALAGAAIADIASLRGVNEIPATQGAPELVKFINDKENVERTFEQQPPLVPHTVDRYAINLKTNECLECHMKEPGKDEAKSVEMSESHFVNRDGKKGDDPVGARHFCNQCHVPQVDAQPLVGTTFRAAVK